MISEWVKYLNEYKGTFQHYEWITYGPLETNLRTTIYSKIFFIEAEVITVNNW